MFGVSGLCYETLRRKYASGVGAGLAYAQWSAVWLAAHAAGAAAVGAGCGWLGGRLPAGPLASYMLGALLVLFGLHEAQFLRLPLPRGTRQVPRDWMFEWPPLATALGYGLQLGAMVTTRITHSASWAALGAALLSRSPWMGSLILMAYGLTRAVPAVVVGPFAAAPERSLALAVRVGATYAYAVHVSSRLLLATGVVILILGVRMS